MNPQTFASALPDLPRYVETRAALIDGGAELLGAELDVSASGVIIEWKFGFVYVVGHPEQQVIRFVASGAKEVIANADNASFVQAALPCWRMERATLHTLRHAGRLPPVPPGSVQLLRDCDRPLLAGLPCDLRIELDAELRAGRPIAASLADGRPVAFCYAGAITEEWWDVAIDTLEPWRRQGLAARCVSYQIERLAVDGKRPVWCSADSNPPSGQLAAKLGFTPVDSLVLFHAPATDMS